MGYTLRFKPFVPGTVDFVVRQAKGHRSKTSQKTSMELIVEVTDINATKETVYVYLSPRFKKLICHFCRAARLEDAYEKGELTCEQCIGVRGKCITILEETEQYGISVKIDDFLKPNGEPTTKGSGLDPSNPAEVKAAVGETFDDDIPF